ncbi:MAG: enoyl-CoA hydratase/isomerase family protein [Acidimicrobiales bacterium]
MSYEGIPGLGVEVVDGIATVTIDDPPINLFTIQLFVSMAGLAERLAVDPQVRVVVLRSANPEFFIAHFDVAAILTFPTDSPPPTELNAYHRMCEAFRTMPKATIAVIEGRVGGGGSELALSCDMRFAALPHGDHPGAVFNQPEVALGILPGGSGTVRLSRLVGRSRALEVILGCDDVDAATAEAWGWVNRALPHDELWPFVDRLARRIAGFPPHAVAAAKACVVRAELEVEPHLLAEGAAFNGTLAGPGAREAMERFLAAGGQSREGELRLGELAGELAE